MSLLKLVSETKIQLIQIAYKLAEIVHDRSLKKQYTFKRL